jgi:hypothetical protein
LGRGVDRREMGDKITRNKVGKVSNTKVAVLITIVQPVADCQSFDV